jgi:hypothetical protein
VESRVEQYLSRVADEAEAVVGADFAGAYAGGSVALDAFDPIRSDIDVALVTRSALSGTVKHQLVERLRHDALECPARGLELVVHRREVAMSGAAEPGFELELNTGPRMDLRVTLRPEDRPAGDGHFWYGLDRSILHQHGVALAGPPASAMFADLAPADLRRLVVASLHWWTERAALAGDGRSPEAADAVLGACRALVRIRSGRWLGKVDAGRWLLAGGWESVDAVVVEESIAARSGGPPPAGARARAFLERVLVEIEGP